MSLKTIEVTTKKDVWVCDNPGCGIQIDFDAEHISTYVATDTANATDFCTPRCAAQYFSHQAGGWFTYVTPKYRPTVVHTDPTHTVTASP